MKRLLLITLVFGIFISCNNNKGKGGSEISSTIQPTSLYGQWINRSDQSRHITLEKNGKMIYCSDELCAFGKWELIGNVISGSYTTADDEKQIKYRIVELLDNQLTVEVEKSEHDTGTVVFILNLKNK